MRPTQVFTYALLFFALLGSGQAQYSVLYNFGSRNGDPLQPFYSGMIAQGRDGNLYSTASGGVNNVGAVFKITPAGTLTTLYSFDTTHGAYPYGGLTIGTDGNFYGTTSGGGTGWGTVFKITQGGTLTVLYSFTNGSDGAAPYAPPIQGTDGNFYGTAFGGGICGNCGTVYKITLSGTFTSLYQFDVTHGVGPSAPLVQGTDGNLYGTTQNGGTNGYGVVFKVTPAGKLTVLYNFDFTHGALPFGPLVQGSDGNFYGTTETGGSGNNGVIFKITPTGNLSVLHNINGTTDGAAPVAGLVQATDGNFYGVNSAGGTNNDGSLFKINSKGSYSVLYNFDGTTGSIPYVTPYQHTNGIVYGDTQQGGAGNVSCSSAGTCGVFYNWSASLAKFVTLLPYSGKVGKTIEFLGQGFTGATGISFNGTAASTFKVVSDNYLTANVPSGATTGSVSVTTPSGTLVSSKKFRITPQLLSFTPASGPVATTVTITGVSLTQTTKVTFGGVLASTFTVNSDTSVTANVPTAAKTGKIAVTTPGGTATSSGTFSVTPQITSFNPTGGAVGTSVVITGASLIQTTTVTFGGVAATSFTVNSDTQVTTSVPTGAITGNIGITTTGGTSTSSSAFTVTVACAPGVSAEQVFTSSAHGCAGTFPHSNASSLCASGWHVCSATEYVSKSGGVLPTHNYWAADTLWYSNTDMTTNRCAVAPPFSSGYSPCTAPEGSMLVCSGSQPDAEGNYCYITGCGLNSPLFNQNFGGCAKTDNAGTMCCSP